MEVSLDPFRIGRNARIQSNIPRLVHTRDYFMRTDAVHVAAVDRHAALASCNTIGSGIHPVNLACRNIECHAVRGIKPGIEVLDRSVINRPALYLMGITITPIEIAATGINLDAARLDKSAEDCPDIGPARKICTENVAS